MNKRYYLTLLLLVGYLQNTFCYSVSEFAQQLKTFNSSYILPLLGAGIGIYALVSGIMRIGKIRKGGEEQTDAIMNWLGSLIWPVVVVVIGEGVVLAFSAIFG
ncbi:MAG: hypothetical protein GXX85_00815 [Ignavibacteria bacterium]|nr:hypothetical protein [Ignavibacteria bacterium]